MHLRISDAYLSSISNTYLSLCIHRNESEEVLPVGVFLLNNFSRKQPWGVPNSEVNIYAHVCVVWIADSVLIRLVSLIQSARTTCTSTDIWFSWHHWPILDPLFRTTWTKAWQTIEYIEQQTCQWHKSWLLLCTLVYDVVETRATALNWIGMLLSNHVARRYIAVRHFYLEGLCQSQNWRLTAICPLLRDSSTTSSFTVIYLVQLQCHYHSLFQRS